MRQYRRMFVRGGVQQLAVEQDREAIVSALMLSVFHSPDETLMLADDVAALAALGAI